MFVGSAVAGCVVLASHGAKARGALLRDVAANAVAISVVAGLLLTGRISVVSAAFLVALYIGELVLPVRVGVTWPCCGWCTCLRVGF